MNKINPFLALLSMLFSGSALAHGQNGMAVGLLYFIGISIVLGFACGVLVTIKKHIQLKHLFLAYYLSGFCLVLFVAFELDNLVVTFLIQTILGVPIMAPMYLLGVCLSNKLIDITTNDIDFPSS